MYALAQTSLTRFIECINFRFIKDLLLLYRFITLIKYLLFNKSKSKFIKQYIDLSKYI